MKTDKKQPGVNITFDFPVLMWYSQKWICNSLKTAQMQLELMENVIYWN